MSFLETSKSHPRPARVIPAHTRIVLPLIRYVTCTFARRSAAPATTPRTSTYPANPPVGTPSPSHRPMRVASSCAIKVHPALPVSRHAEHGYHARPTSAISARSSVDKRKSPALGAALGSYRGGSRRGFLNVSFSFSVSFRFRADASDDRSMCASYASRRSRRAAAGADSFSFPPPSATASSSSSELSSMTSSAARRRCSAASAACALASASARRSAASRASASRADATASRVCVSAQDSRTATRLVSFGPEPARPGTAPASAPPDATDQGFFRFLSSGVGETSSLAPP
mmetsp:Transcript_11620/g.48736  ORF Transcript_11620/g.48736 Transcript_11620/m.48736 type:complete len:289 (+) Transcript_11620:128-994(+)